jgi:hypothetical protein
MKVVTVRCGSAATAVSTSGIIGNGARKRMRSGLIAFTPAPGTSLAATNTMFCSTYGSM